MKDPAVLFYTQDFITGTILMNDEQRGKYIMLLCLQHQNGKLTERDMIKICGKKDEDIWQKFSQDESGFYFNKRMLIESSKRQKFTESRRANAKHMPKHMENENENENINEKEDENKILFEAFRKNYPGTKRGFQVEFDNFKKHKDWKIIIKLLNLRLDYQRAARAKREALKEFVPEWKNLKTWINQRCWEDEIPIGQKQEIPKTYAEMLKLCQDNPAVWHQYKAVRKEGEKQATFYPIK